MNERVCNVCSNPVTDEQLVLLAAMYYVDPNGTEYVAHRSCARDNWRELGEDDEPCCSEGISPRELEEIENERDQLKARVAELEEQVRILEHEIHKYESDY